MKKISVRTGRPYEITIERGILDRAGTEIRSLTKALRAVIVTDSNVAPLYSERLKVSLEGSGFETSVFIFPAGESSKRLSTIGQLYSFLFDHDITRSDIIVALGGGVTGDMAGFAAATYLRGIDFFQIPTTLLSQVDSSVGGKTGVDLPTGKNLVGAFWQPDAVLIDPDTLGTLSDGFYNDGMGEVIKYGCIRSASLFERLEREDSKGFIEEMIHESVSIKRDVVEHDERDTGERAILNFGHTFGHALEKLHNYSGITHGEAVALGALILTELTEAKGITEPGTAARIRALLEKNHMPTQTGFSLGEIIEATRGDKKTSGKTLSFIFLRKIGDCFIQKLPVSGLKDYFGIT